MVDEPEAKFIPLRGEIVGVDWDRGGETVVEVAVDYFPRFLGNKRVHLWVYTDLTAEELEAFDD